MDTENVKRRCEGSGVRPLDWTDKDGGSDSDACEEIVVNEAYNDPPTAICEMDQKEFAKWVSMKWNLLEFDGTKPVCERKSEWERFIEQFARIVSVRNMSSSQKLQALQIQGGQYLNDIIKIQRNRGMCTVEESYEKVICDLNNYFDQTCDAMQERSKFRGLKMSQEESFVDFELRCEKQIKYCSFSKEQADEELADALIRRSIPEISKHLRLLTPTFDNNIFAIIKQGSHLDHIRKEEAEMKSEVESFVKPVMSLQREPYASQSRNAPYYRNSQNNSARQSRNAPYYRNPQNNRGRSMNWTPRSEGFRSSSGGPCGKCSENHQFGNCPAKGKRCMKCGRWGHYAKCCRATVARNHEEEARSINQVKFENEKHEMKSSDEEN